MQLFKAQTVKGFLSHAVQQNVALMLGKIFPGIAGSLDLSGKSAERRLKQIVKDFLHYGLKSFLNVSL